MAVHRAFHVTFYILFLIMLGVVLWFLLYYAGVPGWVWALFGAAIVIAIIGVIIKEVLIKKKEVPCTGEILSPNPLAGWSLAYYIFHVIAFLLIITGIVLVIIYGDYPWWLWILLGVGVALIIIAAMMHVGSAERGIKITAFVLAVIGTITLAVFEVLLVVYSDAPWWIWVLIGVMILFGFLSGGLEPISAENLTGVATCPKPCPTPCPETVPLVSTGITIRQSDYPPPPVMSQVMVAPTPSVVTSQAIAISGPPPPVAVPSQIVVGATPAVTTTQPIITSAPGPAVMIAQPGIVVNPTPGVTVSPPIITGASYRSTLPGMGFP